MSSSRGPLFLYIKKKYITSGEDVIVIVDQGEEKGKVSVSDSGVPSFNNINYSNISSLVSAVLGKAQKKGCWDKLFFSGIALRNIQHQAQHQLAKFNAPSSPPEGYIVWLLMIKEWICTRIGWDYRGITIT